MKCPKCAYVGYEATDRCRHCGYDFSLSLVEPVAPRMEPVPFPAMAREHAMASTEPPAPPEADLPLHAPDAIAAATARFAEPPPARTPLAVRRTTERVRSRGATPVKRPRPALLETAEQETAPDAPDATAAAEAAAPEAAAGAGARLLSAAIDGVLLLAIDASVVYFTAKIANIPLADVVALPLAPLATFLVGLNVAYLAVFTANGGQTLGKMAAGLRVEGTDGPLTFGDATVRVAVAIVGALVVGAGFLPALWRHDRRAVHDQVAHTRVVKVSA